ncbi:DoxX family protein [Rhizobium sp. TRM95796]|uniref:DoxX family protein n=1 Tax=Rhizobium sp. TRM95796 TaxID=2979862 RepID=UPI0021E9612C|nr:DoxX family protein [Rhizobium sp. TRM95796]MCV3768254.1 DoxX family protein [Rhizobium sp. TRM95796]
MIKLKAPPLIAKILDWRGTWLTARLAIVLVFLVSAFGHLFDFGAAVAEQVSYGLPAPEFMAALTVAVEVAGSLLILTGQLVWFGAGMLGVFTALGAVFAHPFWAIQGAARFDALASFLEHVGLVGGLMLVALVARRLEYEEQKNV